MKSAMFILAVGVVAGLMVVPASAALVSQWKMDESSWNGTSGEVLDSVGSNNGTAMKKAGFSGTVANTTNDAKYGRAGEFGRDSENVGNYVRIPDDSSLDLTTGFTAGAWFKPAVDLNGSTPAMKIIAKSVGWNSGWFFEFHSNFGNPLWRFANQIGGSMSYVTQNVSSVTAGTWVHLAGTYDGSTMKLYVNGFEVGSTSVVGAMDVTTNDVTLASQNGDYNFANGVIDDARIYDTALDSAGIAQMMIPEPATMGLLLLGIPMALRRRK